MRRHSPIQLQLLPTTLLLILSNLLVALVSAQSEDYYCGLDWLHAAETCPKSCPTGNDSECTSTLGSDHGCFFFTGCAERVANGEFGTPQPTPSPSAANNSEGSGNDGMLTDEPTPAPTSTPDTSYCGTTWVQSMLTCDTTATPCPNGPSNCNTPTQSCYSGISCTSPLQQLKTSELILTLNGVSNTMDQTSKSIFVETVGDLLTAHLEGVSIAFESVKVEKQELGFSFDYLDVTVVIVAQIRPSSSDDDNGAQQEQQQNNLNVIADEYINKSSRTIVSRLKSNALNKDSVHFVGLDKIGVGLGLTMEPTVKATDEPTGKPTTGMPTRTPTPPPTKFPTLKPTEYPSEMPSESPSRSHLQSITTHTTKELQSLSDTSYGYIFNVRTTESGPAIILTGMDFYSYYSGIVNYELWSKIGTFVGHRGKYESWDLVSTGTLTSYSYGNLISIPEEEFATNTTMSIPGGGGEEGTRAFYLTLNTKDLVYQPFRNEGNQLVTKADSKVHSSSPELEIYNGEAVLGYPFPQSSQSYLYRAPQEFVGAIYYDRLPCKPFSMYGVVQDLPCPTDGFPTHSPTLTPPTGSPVGPVPSASPMTSSPTGSYYVATRKPTLSPASSAPTLSPVSSPTFSPTKSNSPTTSFPPTNNPTPSPVELLRINIVVTLQGIPDEGYLLNQAEGNAFLDMMTRFLNSKSGMTKMVVQLVGMKSQQIVLVDDDRPLGTIASSKVVPRDVIRQRRQSQKNLKGMRTLQQINALQIILILPIQSATLSPEEYGSIALAVIEENEAELLGRLKSLSVSLPYFSDVYSVDAYLSEKPTLTTDTLADKTDTAPMISSDEPEDEATGSNMGAIVGGVVGTFWLCFSVVGLLYLRKRRSRMSTMKETLNWSKANALSTGEEDHLDQGKESSTRSVPMGDAESMDGDASSDEDKSSHSELDDSSDEDESMVVQRKVGLRKSGVSRSVITDRVSARESQAGRLVNSDVITAEERKEIEEKGLRRNDSFDQRRKRGKGKGSLKKSLESSERSDTEEGIDRPQRKRKGKGSLKKSLKDAEREEIEEGIGDVDGPTQRRNFSRRNRLSRSDSQMEIDTTAFDAPQVNRRNNLSQSVVIQSRNDPRQSFELGQSDPDEWNAVSSNPRASLKRSINLKSSKGSGQLRKSLLDKEFETALLVDDSNRSNPQARESRASMRRSSSNKDLKSSNGSGNLRKSLLDKEFETALLVDDSNRSNREFEDALQDVELNPAGLRSSGKNPNRKSQLSNSKLKSSMTRKRTTKAFSQSMKSTTSDDNLADLIDTKIDQRVTVKGYTPKPTSDRKSSRSSNRLSQSAQISNTNYRDLAKQSPRRSLDMSEDTNTDALRSSAKIRTRRSKADRPLSQSAVTPSLGGVEERRASTGVTPDDRIGGKKKKKKRPKGSRDDENEGKKTRKKGKDKETLRKSSKPKSSEESSSSSDESSSSESDASRRKEAVNLTALRAAAKFRGHSRNAAVAKKTKRSPKKGSIEVDKPMSRDADEERKKSTEEAMNLTALRAAAKFRGSARRSTEVDKPMSRDLSEERKKSTDPSALRQSVKQEIRQGDNSQRRSRKTLSQSAVLPSSNDEMPSLLNEYDARRSERENIKRSTKRSSTGDVSRRQLSQSVSMPKAQSSDDMQRLVREARKQGGVKSRRGVSLSRGDEANTLKRSVRKNSLNGSEREAKMRGNDPPALKQSMRRNTSFNSVESLEKMRGKDAALKQSMRRNTSFNSVESLEKMRGKDAALKRSVRKNSSFTLPDTPERTQSRSKRSSSIRKSVNDGVPSADAHPSGRRGLSSSIMMAADTDISAVRRSTKIRGDERRRKSKDVTRQSVRRSGKSDDIADLKRQFIL